MKVPNKKSFGSQSWKFDNTQLNGSWSVWYVKDNSVHSCMNKDTNDHCENKGFFRAQWGTQLDPTGNNYCLSCGITYLKFLVTHKALLERTQDEHEGLVNILANISKFLKKYGEELDIRLDELL